TVIVLPTLPSPMAATLPSTARACGFGAGFGLSFGHVGPGATANTGGEVVDPIAPAVKPVVGANAALRLPSTWACRPRADAVRNPTSWLPLRVALEQTARRVGSLRWAGTRNDPST